VAKTSAASEAASLTGRQSYKARLEPLGIERLLRETARENGKLGGRPKGTGTKAVKKAVTKGAKK
jgi:hypothetical protein